MRVAALLPAATDIVVGLGAGDRLVAVTHACTLSTRLASVPRVTRSRITSSGGAGIGAQVGDLAAAGAPLFELDEDLLAAQRPDVILTQAVCDVCAVREADARAVAARLSPVPVVTTLGATTVEGILTDVLTVGNALDVDDADELVLGLRSRMAAIHRRLKTAQAPRPRVLVLEWTDPPFSAGHWVPDMVRRAGGHEVLGQTGQISTRIEGEALSRVNPDVVLVAPCGYGLEEATCEATRLRAQPSWLRSIPMWAVDANRLTSCPGPGAIHGIEVLAGILHPLLFGAPSPRDAIPIT